MLEYQQSRTYEATNVSVAGCLGYDVLVYKDILHYRFRAFQLLVV